MTLKYYLHVKYAVKDKLYNNDMVGCPINQYFTYILIYLYGGCEKKLCKQKQINIQSKMYKTILLLSTLLGRQLLKIGQSSYIK